MFGLFLVLGLGVGCADLAQTAEENRWEADRLADDLSDLRRDMMRMETLDDYKEAISRIEELEFAAIGHSRTANQLGGQVQQAVAIPNLLAGALGIQQPQPQQPTRDNGFPPWAVAGIGATGLAGLIGLRKQWGRGGGNAPPGYQHPPPLPPQQHRVNGNGAPPQPAYDAARYPTHQNIAPPRATG